MAGGRGGHTIRQSPVLVRVPVGAKTQHRSRNSLAQNLLWLPIPWGSKTEVPHWEQKAFRTRLESVYTYIHIYIYFLLLILSFICGSDLFKMLLFPCIIHVFSRLISCPLAAMCLDRCLLHLPFTFLEGSSLLLEYFNSEEQ